MIADGCLSTNNKVLVAALTFYLSNDSTKNEDDQDSSEDEEKHEKAKKISNLMKTAGVYICFKISFLM